MKPKKKLTPGKKNTGRKASNMENAEGFVGPPSPANRRIKGGAANTGRTFGEVRRMNKFKGKSTSLGGITAPRDEAAETRRRLTLRKSSRPGAYTVGSRREDLDTSSIRVARKKKKAKK